MVFESVTAVILSGSKSVNKGFVHEKCVRAIDELSAETMKEIRQITEVVNPKLGDENNNENELAAQLALDSLDSEPGYYQQVIKPMLAPGHESELLYWLKSTGLIPQTQICKNAANDSCCNKPMSWTPTRCQDSYQWKCLNCMEKRTIRDDSVFCTVKCTFKNAFRILLAWCKSMDAETVANVLGLKKNVVSSLYNIACKTADNYIKNHLHEWQVGGPGVIVIIDTFPEGCTNERQLKNTKPILCCAEVKQVPPRYWFESLERFNKGNAKQVAEVKEKVLNIIRSVVLPGSVLVVNLESTLCSYYDLQPLKFLYPTIVSVDGLSRHNTINQTVLANLQVIWKLGLDVCEEAQFYNIHQIQSFLTGQMWKRRFEGECFEKIINQLVALH